MSSRLVREGDNRADCACVSLPQVSVAGLLMLLPSSSARDTYKHHSRSRTFGRPFTTGIQASAPNPCFSLIPSPQTHSSTTQPPSYHSTQALRETLEGTLEIPSGAPSPSMSMTYVYLRLHAVRGSCSPSGFAIDSAQTFSGPRAPPLGHNSVVRMSKPLRCSLGCAS